MTLADELCLLALQIERAGTDPEALVLCRLEFQSLWEKFRSDTEAMYQSFTIDAADEFRLQMEEDAAPAPAIALVREK